LSNSIIQVERLSKRYVIGHQRDNGLRHRIEDSIRHPLQWLRSKSPRLENSEFWALNDVSFEVNSGDVVGIIGRNGAGKSTLLKILSRITIPTSGRVRLKGRVASLLEVGTGFHQELTGRENIFLNGAILGMAKVEIRRKFDEIVAFSEIEEFLDTPVKRYSSGMYMRLAFAVAAHLEPEILIVDEVLAVGDAQFQKKCLGKMEDVAHHGRTVIFVSHNMAAVRTLCSRGLLLRQGTVQKFGSISEVVDSYLTDGVEYSGYWVRERPIPESEGIYFEEVRIYNEAGDLAGHLDCTGSFSIEMCLQTTGVFDRALIAIRITNQDGVPVLTTCNTDIHRGFVRFEPGFQTIRVTIPANFLVPGTYTLALATQIPSYQLFDAIDNTIAICIEETGSVAMITNDQRVGVVNPILPWTMEEKAPSIKK
jgi:lipopolysaccharide transport system ATP-binding protein